jgi:hypothetical protein
MNESFLEYFHTRKHGLNPLHSSNQTYPSGKEIMTSKFPLPIVLCGLLVEVAHLFIHLSGMCAIIFEVGSVPKS